MIPLAFAFIIICATCLARLVRIGMANGVSIEKCAGAFFFRQVPSISEYVSSTLEPKSPV